MNIPSSGHHWIEELSEKHKPKIHLHQTEYCGPIYFNHMSTQPRAGEKEEGGMYLKNQYISGRGEKVLPLIKRFWFANKNNYVNFADWCLKEDHPDEHKMVFSRGKVVDDLAFVQYWMFYPSSTLGTDDAEDDEKAPVYHEGDWEKMQVVVKLDKATKRLTPIAATAAQHYEGQTLPWDKIQHPNKYNPIIYIAAGSHATFFSTGIFPKKFLGGLIEINIRDHTDRPKPNPEVYTLSPFEPRMDFIWWWWGGHWGEYKKSPKLDNFFSTLVGEESSSGPLSPPYIGSAPLPKPDDPGNMFERPKEFYERSK